MPNLANAPRTATAAERYPELVNGTNSTLFSLAESPSADPPQQTTPARRRSIEKVSWIIALLLFLMNSTGSSAQPTGPKPRWVNPCDLPGHVFDPSTDMDGAPPMRLAELYSSIKERARVANRHAKDIRNKFVKMYFTDPDMIPGMSNYRQNWLPKIPPLKEEFFRGTKSKEAFVKSFEVLQFFAVGVEQIILDQVINDGQFLNHFRDIENHLTQVLCELQLGLFTLRVPPSRDVLRDVMSQEYRDVPGRSLRNIRDYMILRDYVEATQYVASLFEYMERTL